jgi:hypothetical protein
MTLQAESPNVRQAALASSLHYREDMIRIPKMPACAPLPLESAPGCPVEFTFVFAEGFRVQAALRAHAAVAREYLLPQISGIGAQPPFVDAFLGAEREASLRHLGPTPPADVTAMRAFGLVPPIYPSTGLRSACAHTLRS